MKEISSISQTIQEDIIIDKDYQESIVISKGATLTIKGQTNRLIIVNKGGKVIIEGVANRINGFGGDITIEQNGYVDSIYSGGGCQKINVNGTVHEIFILNGGILNVNEGSHILSISNEDSQVIIDRNTYIKNYGQWGKKASCNLIGDGDHIIQNMNINCGDKNE